MSISRIEMKVVINSRKICDLIAIGCIIYYKGTNYMVSVYHGMPIEDFVTINYGKSKQQAKIKTIPVWNELILINCSNLNDLIIPIKSFRIQPPTENEKLYAKNDDIGFKYLSNVFMPLNMIPGNPLLMYYKVELIYGNIKQSYSGLPIFDKKKKLIGVFSKLENEKYGYIIPYYYIKRTICKDKSNNGIYFPQSILGKKVVKIDNNKVTCNKIYNKSLKTYLPISCHLLLEGENKKNIRIILKNNISIQDKYCDINSLYPINNSYQIIYENNHVLITTALILLLKKIGLCCKAFEIVSNIIIKKKKISYIKFLENELSINSLDNFIIVYPLESK